MDNAICLLISSPQSLKSDVVLQIPECCFISAELYGSPPVVGAKGASESADHCGFVYAQITYMTVSMNVPDA